MELNVPKTNPLLSRVVIPGETFKLPSGGLFYIDGELDSSVTNGEVVVHPMTAIDEINMKSPDKIISGKAIIDVFSRCIPQVLKPNALFSKDIDYLMLCLRKVTYGDDTDVRYKHSCDGAKLHTYTTKMSQFITASKNIDPTSINSKYTVTVDNGQVVKIHPIKFMDVMTMLQASSTMHDDAASDKIQQEMFRAVVNVIHSVDEVTDKEQIYEWATSIPATWFNKISDAVDQNSDWGPMMNFKTKCLDCGQEVVVDVPMNPLVFFTQF